MKLILKTSIGEHERFGLVDISVGVQEISQQIKLSNILRLSHKTCMVRRMMKTMNKAYEYRIYPTEYQETQFKKIIGLNRLYWNICVFQKQQDHSFKIEGYKPIFQKFKPEALEWLKEVDCNPAGQTYMDLHQAYQNFFNSIKKQRKGKFVRKPKFKSKKNPKDSFRFSSVSNPRFKDGKLLLTRKLGTIEGSFGCRFCEGKLKSVTFSRTKTGKWFCKILVEKKEEKKCDNRKLIGIDWNCLDEDFIVRSDDAKIKCPRFLKRKQVQLKRKQQTLSRRFVKGKETQSSNYEKAKFQVAKLHEKVAWQRKDWLHKISRDLGNNFEFVAIENINMQVMGSNLNHGKVVGDQGFGMLRSFLTYKTNLLKVNPKNTSKTCSVCGNINETLTLADRYWTCSVCETKHDRDINAAKNIMRLGRELSERDKNVCGEAITSAKQKSHKPSKGQSNVA